MEFSKEALNLLAETISSERKYYESIEVFHVALVKPLVSAEPTEVMVKLERDLATVLLVSKRLLEEMEESDARGQFAKQFAEILSTWSPMLKSYKDYVSGMQRAREEHASLQRSSRKYAKALAAAQAKKR